MGKGETSCKKFPLSPRSFIPFLSHRALDQIRNDRHDGTLFIGLENDITGEEIVVTLAPEVQSNGDVQTRVNIDQLKGDETNEERKQYYRDSIQKVVCDSTPGAQVRLECKKGTRNKLSQRTDLRNRIKES